MNTEDRWRTDVALGALGAAMNRNEPERTVLAAFKSLENAVPETSGIFFEMDPDGNVLLSHFGLAGSSPEAQDARDRLLHAAEDAGMQDAVRPAGRNSQEVLYLQVLPAAPRIGLRALQDMVFALDDEPCPDAEQDGAPAPGM